MHPAPLCNKQLDLALLMPMVRSMSPYRLTRSLFITCIITAAGLSAQAQVDSGDVQPPTVSRGCLWNADINTWKSLGLKRSQVARMNELREQYPAVVDGQWVADETVFTPVPAAADRMQAAPNLSTSLSGPAAGAAITERKDEARTPENRPRPTGLQYQLREVLTPAQLRQWAAECGF